HEALRQVRAALEDAVAAARARYRHTHPADLVPRQPVLLEVCADRFHPPLDDRLGAVLGPGRPLEQADRDRRPIAPHRADLRRRCPAICANEDQLPRAHRYHLAFNAGVYETPPPPHHDSMTGYSAQAAAAGQRTCAMIRLPTA